MIQFGDNKIFTFVFISRYNKVIISRIKATYENPIFPDLSTKYKDTVKFVFVFIENNRELFKTYDVSIIPTFIFFKIDKKGDTPNPILSEITRVNGTENLKDTIIQVNNILKKYV
jgi:hypothetical protein